MNSVEVTSCNHSQGWPMVRVAMSQTTESEKPKHRMPHNIISASSSQSSARHFRCCCRCKTSLSAIAIVQLSRSDKFLVVPANAGTHNHRRLLWKESWRPYHPLEGPRSMGPGVRRDDQ